MEGEDVQGPTIYDYQDEEKLCGGLKYTLPKDFYVPLRNANTKDGRSQAQTIYGSAKPSTKKVHYRNPKMYIKKSGDMSQRFALRSKQDLSDPVFERARAGNVDRYYGSDYYQRMYGALEMTSWACKYRPSEAIQALNDKGKIDRPPKGAENIKGKNRLSQY